MKRLLSFGFEGVVAAAHLYRELAVSALSLLPSVQRRAKREPLVPASAS